MSRTPYLGLAVAAAVWAPAFHMRGEVSVRGHQLKRPLSPSHPGRIRRHAWRSRRSGVAGCRRNPRAAVFVEVLVSIACFHPQNSLPITNSNGGKDFEVDPAEQLAARFEDSCHHTGTTLSADEFQRAEKDTQVRRSETRHLFQRRIGISQIAS